MRRWALCGCGRKYVNSNGEKACWQCSGVKLCNKCNEWKSTDEFYRKTNGRINPECNECRNLARRDKTAAKMVVTYKKRPPKFDNREQAMVSHHLTFHDRLLFDECEPAVRAQLMALKHGGSSKGRGSADAVLRHNGVTFDGARKQWLRIATCLLDVAHLEKWSER